MLYKNKEEYFISLEKLSNDSYEKFLKASKLFQDIDPKEHKKQYLYYQKEIFFLKMNSEKDSLKYVKENLSDEIFEHINYYALDLDIIDLYNLIMMKKELGYHKEKKCSSDGSEFEREIQKIKDDADKLINMSTTDSQLTVKLPRHEHTIRYDLRMYFEEKGKLTKDEISNLFTLFPKKGLPRKGVKTSEKMVDINEEYGQQCMERMGNNFSFREIFNTNAFREHEFMKNKNEAYFYKAKIKNDRKNKK